MKVQTSCHELASRFIGVEEADGLVDNPMILGWLRLDQEWPEHDEVPWCSAFVNFVAFCLGLPRSRSLQARSWLKVGTAVDLAHAEMGNDVVVLSRGPAPQGHVGLFSGRDAGLVHVLGGNQGDSVSIQSFPEERVIGVRRLL